MSFFQQLGSFFRTSNEATTTTNDSIDNDTTNTPSNNGSLSTEETLMVTKETTKEEELDLPVYAGLERYQLLNKLGDGAFSLVYKAVDQESQENVAIKVVRKYQLNSGQKSSVLKEVQLMRSFQHDSIVSLLGFIETDEFYFLILELCNGGELFHQIVHLTYFSEDLARHCILQVAEGIRYLHEVKGVIHRDIKPENLLFNSIPILASDNSSDINGGAVSQKFHDDLALDLEQEEEKVDEGKFIPNYGGGGIGQVKIADFGLSKVIWDQQTQTPCGTIGYTAPEIVRDERYSKSVDMWALGCVLYTMLCGFPPFHDECIDILTEKVAKGEYTFLAPWWDSISDEAKDLVSHLLCVDPNERFDIHQFMQHPWMTQQTSSLANNEHAKPVIDDILAPASTTTSVAIETIEAKIPPSTLSEHRRDLLKTAISSMKAMFDVSYKVHRRSEEQALRKGKSKRRGFFFGYSLNSYDTDDTDTDDTDDTEEDDDDDEYDSINCTPEDDITLASSQSASGDSPVTHNNPVALNLYSGHPLDRSDIKTKTFDSAKASSMTTDPMNSENISLQLDKDSAKKSRHRNNPLFQLDLSKATLLERRKTQGGITSIMPLASMLQT